MSVFKWILIGLAGLSVVVAALAAYGLYYLQNNDLRGLVAWGAERQGYKVRADGPVTLDLWPQVIVKVNKLNVDSLQGEGSLFSVDAAAVRINWGSGLLPWKGMQLTDVEAKNPVVTLRRSAEGVANWMPADVSASTTVATSAHAESQQEQLASVLSMLVSTRLAVANLNMTYDDAMTGRKVLVKGMNMMATTDGSRAVTRISGQVNGQQVTGDLQVDVANLANVPVTAKLNGAGLAVAVDGRIIEQSQFAGQVSAQTANIRNSLAALLGKAPAQVPADAFRLTGDATLGAERVVLRNFNTSLGELLQASGNVDIRLGDTPAASGQIRISGSDLRALAELGTSRQQPGLPALPFTLATNLSGQDRIELKNTSFTLGNLASVLGEAIVIPSPAAGGTPNVDAKIRINISNLRALARSAGNQAALPEQPVSGDVVVKMDKGGYSLPSFDIRLAELAQVNGTFKFVPGPKPDVRGSVTLTGQNVKEAARAFGVASAAVPAGPFRVAGTVAGQGVFNVDDLVVNLPQLFEATGKIAYTPGRPVNINGSLDVSRLNATALGYCKRVDASASSSAAQPVAAAPAQAADTPWNDEPLNLDALRNFAFDLTLNVKGLSCESFPATAAKVRVVNTPSQLDVKDMVLSMAQAGTVKADATLEHAGTPKLMLNLQTAALPVQELVPTLKTKGVVLPLDMKASLSSVGETTRSLAKNLGGSLSLSSKNGQLPYATMLGNVVNIERVLQGGAALPANGNGSVDSFAASYTIRQGVASTDSFDLSTGGGSMKLTGSGTIDIGNWVINYTLTPSVQASSAVAVPVVIRGPLGAPSIGADPAFIQKLTGRLAGEGIQQLLGVSKEDSKGIGAAVGDMISGKGLTSGTVGNILNTFVKPKSPAVSSTAVSGTGSTGNSGGQPNAVDVLRGVLGR